METRETTTTRETRSRLAEAVAALAEPRVERSTVFDEEGRVERLHAVEHPPLLARLRDAVRPSREGSAGSAVPASMRNVIDGTALYEYTKMASAIGDWCRLAGIDAGRDPIAGLLAWHDAWVASSRADAHREAWHERQLRGFARTIRAHLDPPTRVELEFPCPVCGRRDWTDREDGGVWPLRMEYRREDDGSLSDVQVLCRACATRWEGLEAVVELGDELAEKHPVPICGTPVAV